MNNQPGNANQIFWSVKSQDVLLSLKSTENGLKDEDALKRLIEYGPNTFKKSSKVSGLLLFLLQFKSPLTILLIMAAILLKILGDNTDAIIIFIIIFVSCALGLFKLNLKSEPEILFLDKIFICQSLTSTINNKES